MPHMLDSLTMRTPEIDRLLDHVLRASELMALTDLATGDFVERALVLRLAPPERLQRLAWFGLWDATYEIVTLKGYAVVATAFARESQKGGGL